MLLEAPPPKKQKTKTKQTNDDNNHHQVQSSNLRFVISKLKVKNIKRGQSICQRGKKEKKNGKIYESVSLFNGVSIFVGYLKLKSILLELEWNDLTQSWGDFLCVGS